MKAAVVDYDLGNLPSVTKALERIGVDAPIIDGPDGFTDDLDAVVLPGVGHFGAGAHNLADRKLDGPLKAWASGGRPLLGICVGLQLFFERSEEDPDARGLGIVDGDVKLLKAPKVPHMGWNTLETTGGTVAAGVGPEDLVYFVHSYYVDPDPSAVSATTTYGQRFCSVVEQDNIVGVQFHPEKSADVGRCVLERFFQRLR
ncbi:MAG TPA: imidazole glycerol phosphate synthase subunit HisH [Actinomycetota bacterium]|nr:imidazole glycerol phosphate synthase subunit HisH [Actinomycetota bacterium]